MCHPLTVGFGNSHHVRQGADGQFLGAVLDEIDTAAGHPELFDNALGVDLDRVSMRRTCLGVNAALTNLRSLVCRGGSIARNDCDASSSSAGTFSNSTPLPDKNTSLVRLTATMSARRVTAQNPGSLGSWMSASSTGGCQLTGRSARNTENELSRCAALDAQNARDDRSIVS